MSDSSLQKRDAKKSWTLSAALGALALAAGLIAGPKPAHALVIDRALNEQVVMVPAVSGNETIELETTIFRPPGDGPFPLLIMNHGKALGNPRNQGRDRFLVLSREFVKRGYAVVIPMRKGFSRSSGEYADPGCDMTAHGRLQAEDLEGTLAFLRTQPWADNDRIVVAGQSYGGLTAIAFGTHTAPGVRGLINFAGGLKMHGGSCQWQRSLVDAFATFGSHTQLPSLWFYGENDHHFGPELAARMYSAYVQAGGNARMVAYGPFKKDAHAMSGSRDGVQIWWPETERFLKELGMPTETVVALEDDIRIPKVEYAAIDNVEAIPFLRGNARNQYRVFLSKPEPRAFALSPSGAWSWAEDGDDPVGQALADCQKNSSQPCRLYAVDNHVVWSEDQPVIATVDGPARVEVPMTADAAGMVPLPPTAAASASAGAPASPSTAAVTGP